MTTKKKVPKKTKLSRSRAVTSASILEELVRAVCTEHACDPSRPSVVTSLLANGAWYASVVRYNERFGGGKRVVCSVNADTFDEAIRDLSITWIARRNAPKKLHELLESHRRNRVWDENSTYDFEVFRDD